MKMRFYIAAITSVVVLAVVGCGERKSTTVRTDGTPSVETSGPTTIKTEPAKKEDTAAVPGSREGASVTPRKSTEVQVETGTTPSSSTER